MSEAAPETKEAPAPRAPSAGEVLELSLTALVGAPGVFAGLAARPAPGPGSSFLAALAWGALFFALNLVHVAVSNPAVLRSYPSWQIGVVGILGLGAWASLYLLASSLVYGLGRGLGTEGDFDRALLIAAVALSAAPAQALCRWFPAAWFAPALLAAWITACGLSALFKTDAWAARGACAVLAAAVLGLQYGSSLLVEKYSAAAQMAAVAAQAAPSAEQIAELQRQMLQVQSLSAQAPPDPQPQANQSSLDLLRGPGGEEAPAAGPGELQQIKQMTAQGDAMNKSMAGMLDTITPLLGNPAITKNMSPQQKADFAELTSMIKDLKAGMASNSITSPQEQQAKMLKVQQLVMRVMSAGMTMPAPEPGAKK